MPAFQAFLFNRPVDSQLSLAYRRNALSDQLINAIGKNVLRSNFLYRSDIETETSKLLPISAGLMLLAGILYLIKEGINGRLIFPLEFLYLLLSGILLYRIADLFLIKLYVPVRYIEHSIPLVTMVVFALVVGCLTRKLILRAGVRKSVQIVLIILVLLNFNSMKHHPGVMDFSANKELYSYLKTLPKYVMVVAPPFLADNIPTFAQRKVFFNYELAVPLYDEYWKIVKRRIFDFFDAYYSENLEVIYIFLLKNQIDYLVVDEEHFTKGYLARGEVFMEPFNSYVKKLVGQRGEFALIHVPKEDKLFSIGSIYVIDKAKIKSRIHKLKQEVRRNGN